MNKKQYEDQVNQFIGHRISKVVYFEIDYGDNEYHFFDKPRFDSLDFGLEITFSNGDCRSITWGHEFTQYGLSILNRAFSAFQEVDRLLDVTGKSRWSNLIGQKIEKSEAFWSWSEELGKPETRVYYPQDILFKFENGLSVVISALEIREDGFIMGMMDHVTVFFEKEVARSYKCLIRV